MAELFELNPELLLEQSQEMISLRAAYESLCDNMRADLQGINSSWSDLLSNNFTGKIASAQKSFLGALNMLTNSAGKAALVANTALEMDNTWASKIGGSMFNPTTLNDLLALTLGDVLKDASGNAKNALDMINSLKEKMDGELTASQKAFLEYLGKEKLGSDVIKSIEIGEKFLQGDYAGALQDLSEASLKGMFKVVCGEEGAFYYNFGIDIGEAIAEFVQDPSAEAAGKIAWNASVQPVLDTAGGTIEDVIKLIPGISEYYYDENGAEDIGDVANIALGDFYGLFGEEAKQYAANYYDEQGGLWEGIYNGRQEFFSYVVDSGGFGEALSNLFRTAAKDVGEAGANAAENAEYLLDAIKRFLSGSGSVGGGGGGSW